METSIVIACPSIGKCHCHNNTWEGSLYCDYECHADAARWAAPDNLREEHPQGEDDFYMALRDSCVLWGKFSVKKVEDKQEESQQHRGDMC